MAIVGAPIDLENACVQPPLFYECTDALLCGQAITHGCLEGSDEVAVFPNTCLPAGYVPCDEVKVVGPCE